MWVLERTCPVCRLLLIRLFQPKRYILGVVEPCTTTAGGDLKQPDKHVPTNQDLATPLLIWATGFDKNV